MITLFRSVIDRVKAMFTLDAMLDLEQRFAERQAERKADLIRTADRYDREGMPKVAVDLRRQADELSEQRPLQSVMPFLESDRPTTTARRIEDRRANKPPLLNHRVLNKPKKGK